VLLLLLLLILLHLIQNLIPAYRHHIKLKLGNEDDDCYPQEETKVVKWGLKGYGTFAAVLSACFIALCCMVAILLYIIARRKNIGNSLTSAVEMRIKQNDMYALSKIGKDSVYSYFVTDKIFGWMAALTTLCLQFGILLFFINASEANLQNDRTDVQFTWKCPRDTYACENTAGLTDAGWAIFSVLMVAFLSKDLISGSKLINHSARITHSFKSRIRFFFGGLCLCWFTLFALYVSCCCCVFSCSFYRSCTNWYQLFLRFFILRSVPSTTRL